MDEIETDQHGRRRLTEIPEDNEFVGDTIADRFLDGHSLERSFFVGTTIRNCAFTAMDMNNTELRDAVLSFSNLSNVDLKGSDFVDCGVNDVVFSTCTFNEGEWRGSKFRDCTFEQCTFFHTTISLCTFVRCKFDDATLSSMLHRAVRQNTFSECETPFAIADIIFASRNFGLRFEDATVSSSITAPSLNEPGTLGGICLSNSRGLLRASSLPTVLRAVCVLLVNEDNLGVASLEFFVLIIDVLTAERRISAITVVLLRRILSETVQALQSGPAVTAVMAAVVAFNQVLILIAAESDTIDRDSSLKASVATMTVEFADTFTKHHAETLRLALNIGVGGDYFRLAEFCSGSTFIVYACGEVLGVAALLGTVNSLIRQATVTVQRVGEFEQSLRALQRSRKKRPRKGALAVSSRANSETLLQPEVHHPRIAAMWQQSRIDPKALCDLDVPGRVDIVEQ